jgi:hypothetical protein
MSKVLLIDGPYKDVEVEPKSRGATVLIGGQLPDGTELPDDKYARYRPTRDRTKYRFKGWSESVISLPLPGAAANE